MVLLTGLETLGGHYRMCVELVGLIVPSPSGVGLGRQLKMKFFIRETG